MVLVGQRPSLVRVSAEEWSFSSVCDRVTIDKCRRKGFLFSGELPITE